MALAGKGTNCMRQTKNARVQRMQGKHEFEAFRRGVSGGGIQVACVQGHETKSSPNTCLSELDTDRFCVCFGCENAGISGLLFGGDLQKHIHVRHGRCAPVRPAEQTVTGLLGQRLKSTRGTCSLKGQPPPRLLSAWGVKPPDSFWSF